jgi:hypothetical protein
MMPARAATPPAAMLRLAAVVAVGSAVTLIAAAAQRFPGNDLKPTPLLTPPAGASDVPAPPWLVIGLPKQSKPFTRFSIVTLDGQRVLRVEAVASYGNLDHPLVEVPEGTRRLSWRWRVDALVADADLRRKDGDDSPIKVCALFDLPMSALPFVDRQLLRMARVSAGEILPAASVCYVWDNLLAPGTVLDNAFTRRVRTIVLRGPETPLRGWVSEQRDVVADFLRLFGDEAKTVPPLMGVAVGADADNTGGRSLAFVGAIKLD